MEIRDFNNDDWANNSNAKHIGGCSPVAVHAEDWAVWIDGDSITVHGWYRDEPYHGVRTIQIPVKEFAEGILRGLIQYLDNHDTEAMADVGRYLGVTLAKV